MPSTDKGSRQLKRKFKSNEVIVNHKSSFKHHMVKSQEILDNIHYDKVVLKAMGKATTRAANLALKLNDNNYNTLEIKPKTYSVEVFEYNSRKPLIGADKDAFNPDAFVVKDMQPKYIPAIEIGVCKSKLEIEKMRQVVNKLDLFKNDR